MKSRVKLGTRKSLLAWAQSNWVAKEVERYHPNIQVELVGIETAGDRIQDVALKNLPGKDFFVAELDRALLSGEVDFTVHSMKDLSLTRPPGITLAAIPARENPRDIILWSPEAVRRIHQGEPIRVGTSAPRRLENIPPFLARALPKTKCGHRSAIEWTEIRGNINTRMNRLHEQMTSPRYLDGVVLAFAGLVRLWRDPQGQIELQRLLQGLRWMILPLDHCPTAPAQGALAVECRQDDVEWIKTLQMLHHPDTAAQVQLERDILAEWGGGCHQPLGATAITHSEFESLLWIRGLKGGSEQIQEARWTTPEVTLIPPDQVWDGKMWRKQSEVALFSRNSTQLAFDSQTSDAVLVAHSQAVRECDLGWLSTKRIWTAGVQSWFKLADQGLWVEGCAEGLGFHFISELWNTEILQLTAFDRCCVLTHHKALEEWQQLGFVAIATYETNVIYKKEAQDELKKASLAFWSSGSQYLALKEEVPAQLLHACGPGKTVQVLRAHGIKPMVFPSYEEWRKWLKQKSYRSDG